jgi:hypothetical protein
MSALRIWTSCESRGLIGDEHYGRGLELLERVVMRMIDPDRQGEPITPTVSFPCTCTARITGPITSTATAPFRHSPSQATAGSPIVRE